MVYTEKKRCLLFGLPLSFTTYNINEELISVTSGLLSKTENDSYLYKIVDVRLEQSFFERIFGLGTVHCFGGDVTDPSLKLKHIRRAREIKDYIFHQSEAERLKRRTMNTMNIDGGHRVAEMAMADFDGNN